ncbi:MAG: L-threonylcarbamoyladenylate synthase [Nitrospinales bacterium]
MAENIRIDFDDLSRSKTQIEKIKEILDVGGVIAYPTDTFYALGANLHNDEAMQTIYRIKQRPSTKPFMALVHSVESLNSLVSDFTSDADKLMEAFWPGPLTIIFNVLPHLPAKVTAYTGKIAVRIPGNAFTRKLLEGINYPLTGTSANISGEKDLTSALEVDEQLGTQISAIIEGGDPPCEKPSTIFDSTVDPWKIIREGVISKEQIESVIGTQDDLGIEII